jgi:hypothetical protein
VWVGRQEIMLGDSLHEKIDEGLAASRYGLVILSPAFLAKRFPRKELNSLSAVEDAAGRTVILPVWHGVDQAVLAQLAPTLADRIAANTADGIDAVAAAVVAVVTKAGPTTDGIEGRTPLRLLHELLDSEPQRAAVVDFLHAHPSLIPRTLGQDRDRQWSVVLGPATLDLAVVQRMYTASVSKWTLVRFGPSNAPMIGDTGLTPDVASCVQDLNDVRRWMGRHLREARVVLTDISVDFDAVVVAGRRTQLDAATADALRILNDRSRGLVIRTYDWIIDAAAG